MRRAPGWRTYMATTSVPRFVGSRRASTPPRRGTPLSSTTAPSAAAAAGEGGGSTPYDGGEGGKKAKRAATVEATAPIAALADRRADGCALGLGCGEAEVAESEEEERGRWVEMRGRGEFGILMGAAPSSRKLLRSEGKRERGQRRRWFVKLRVGPPGRVIRVANDLI